MKNKIILVITVSLILIFGGCKKEEEKIVLPTFSEYLSSKSNLSIFSAVIDRANLGNFKNGNGPFTWFAPSNDALTSIGLTLDSVNRMPPGLASYFINYHLLNSRFPSTEMVAQNSFPKATAQGSSVFIGSNGGNFFANGSKIISLDGATSNGMVHTIDRVNTPPQLIGTVQNILSSTGQHTIFIAALNRATRWTPLATTSVFTIFAPTDVAMTNAGLTAAIIAGLPAGVNTRVDSIVRYHYFNSIRLFSNDLGTKETPQTALGAGRSITSLENGLKIKGKNNNTSFLFLKNDILGTNGVVHIIDGVLKY
jgi:transforming growth factor-beta-induced protein